MFKRTSLFLAAVLAACVMSCGAMQNSASDSSAIAATGTQDVLASQVQKNTAAIKTLEGNVAKILADKSVGLSRSLGRIIAESWALTKGCASVAFIVSLINTQSAQSLTTLPGFWYASIVASLAAAYGLRNV